MSAIPIERAAAEGRQDRPDSVQQRASLHPKAVAKAAASKQPKSRRSPTPGKSSRVVRSQVDQRVWSVALAAARKRGLTAQHIQVVSPAEVIVLNQRVRG